MSCDVLFTARLPRAALAARCTSRSGFWSRKRIGSNVSRSTSRTSVRGGGQTFGAAMTCRVLVPLSVISAKVKLADLCKSMLSEYTSVDKARRGSPEKKSVSARWRRSVNSGAAQRWRVEVRFQGSSGDRQQLHARCQPAQGHRCCPWSGL